MMRFSFLILLLFICGISNAQLGKTENEIVSKNGTYNETDTDKNGEKWLYYYSNESSLLSGKYIRITMYVLNKKGICNYIVLTDPASEFKEWKKYLDENFAKNEGLENSWTDNKTHAIIDIEIFGENMSINFATENYMDW